MGGTISPLPFCVVQRPVRLVKQGFHIAETAVCNGADGRRSDTCCHRATMPGDGLKRCPDALPDASGFVRICLRKNNRELLAAVPGHTAVGQTLFSSQQVRYLF